MGSLLTETLLKVLSPNPYPGTIDLHKLFGLRSNPDSNKEVGLTRYRKFNSSQARVQNREVNQSQNYNRVGGQCAG